MRLLRQELHNVCQHRNLVWDFQPGLVGIFGANGSGKSSALNAGAYAALTNDYSRVVGGKEGAICQQAGDEPSWSKIQAAHKGVEFEITRTLQPSNRHRLSANSLEEDFTKAGNIKLWVEDVLGLDRFLIDNYLFVGQRDLTAFLNESSTVRAKALSRLCRTTHAEKCWDALGKQIENDRPLAARTIDTTDEMRKGIGEYRAKLAAEKKKLSAAKKKLLKVAAKKAAQAVVKMSETLGRLERELHDAQDNEGDLLVTTKDAFKASKEKQKQVNAASEGYETAACHAQVSKVRLDTYNANKKRWGRLVDRRATLKRLQETEIEFPEKPTLPDEDFLTAEWSQAKADVTQWRKWLKTYASGAAVCDECGATLDNDLAELRMKDYQEQLPVREGVEQTCREQLGEWREYQTAVIETKAALESHKHLLKLAEEAADEYSEVTEPKPIDAERIQVRLAAEKEARELLHGCADDDDDEGLLGELRKLDTKKSELKGKHQAAKDRVTELEEQVEANQVTGAELKVACQQLEDDATAHAEKSLAQVLVENYQTSIDEKKEELARVKLLLSRSSRAGDWLQLQERMREKLHRDCLPRRVHRRALRRMEGGVNEILEQFDSPFWVRTDDELRFVAHFPNGTVMPGEGLSGGEQAVLALAHRWTLNSMFASQIGMLVLDEPTANLDTRNLDCLEAALTNLKPLVKAQDYQVIIITHHQQLQRVFDQVITL